MMHNQYSSNELELSRFGAYKPGILGSIGLRAMPAAGIHASVSGPLRSRCTTALGRVVVSGHNLRPG